MVAMSPDHVPRLYNVLSSEKFGEGLSDKVQGPDLRTRFGYVGVSQVPFDSDVFITDYYR